jgi:uncharacterized protein YkwD
MKGNPQMKVRLAGLVMLCCAVVAVVFFSERPATFSQTTKTSTASLSQAEQDLIKEINQARSNPQTYAGYLEKLKPLFKGKMYTAEGTSAALETLEGWSAVEDAIKFLRAARATGPLSVSQGLSLCAKAHVTDQSSTGATGHRGGDRTMVEDRVKPYGSWSGGIGENLAYGKQSARERLLTWLIDDGFATRGHRNRIMNSSYNVAGLSCGPHPEYGTMCVLTLAGGFNDASTAKSSGPTNGNSMTSTNSTQAIRTANNNTSSKPANSNSTTANANKGGASKPRKL